MSFAANTPLLFGPTWAFDFNATARRIRLASVDRRGLVRQRRYEMRIYQTSGGLYVPTAAQILQGGPTVTVVAPTAQGVIDIAVGVLNGGRIIKSSERWVIDVYDTTTNYISVLRDVTTNQNGIIELALIDSLTNDDPPLWVS